jgi:tetratricopeptide (TPR) repeat protein
MTLANRSLTTALLLSVLAAAVPAQASALEVRNDIEFARGLAAQWQFVDMAEEVLDGLEAGGLEGSLAEEVALARCDVYAAAASNELRAERRSPLYEKAVAAYQTFLEEHPYSDHKRAAERAYVNVSNRFAGHLARQLEDAAGEERTALQEQIVAVLTPAVAYTQVIIDDGENAETEAEKREQRVQKLNRGQMLILLGQTSDDGSYYFGQAQTVLEKLAFEAGERDPMGLQAYLELGRVYAAQSLHEEAASYFEFVLDFAYPRDPDALALTIEAADQGELDARWSLAERGIKDLLEAYTSAGLPAEASAWALHYVNVWRAQGFNLSPLGYRGLLSVARVLLDSGGWVGGSLNRGDLAWFQTLDEIQEAGFPARQRRQSSDVALSLAQTVNRDNRGTVLQLWAQKLISDLIDRPGVAVAPDVLFEAAQGEYHARNFPSAIRSYKRLLASLTLQDTATQQEFAPKVMQDLGKSYQRMGRSLEAAVAFREGVERWGKADPAMDGMNAKAFLASAKQLDRSAGGEEKVFGAMVRDAEALVLEFAVDDSGDILFTQALSKFDAKDWAGARVAFQNVPGDATNAEKARAHAALCLLRDGQTESAEAEFTEYLEWTEDPANAITSDTKVLRRREAQGMAVFYLGQTAGKRKEYERVVELLGDYYSRFPDQTGYAPRTLYYVLVAHLGLEDFDAAKATHTTMREVFPENSDTGRGATKIFTVYSEKMSAAEEAGDGERAERMRRGAAEQMRLSNQLASDPAYANLVVEASLWQALEEWGETERVLSETVRRYGETDDADLRDKLQRRELPALGNALIRLERVEEAAEVLRPLVPADPDEKKPALKPAATTVANLARALGGWVEGEGRTVREVPGLGGEENIQLALKWWRKLLSAQGAKEKWVEDWYELKFMTIYTTYQWGLEDSARIDSARNLLRQLETDLEDPDLMLIREASGGDDTLRQRFLWLQRKLR